MWLYINNWNKVEEDLLCKNMLDVQNFLASLFAKESKRLQEALDAMEAKMRGDQNGEHQGEMWSYYQARVSLLEKDILPYVLDEEAVAKTVERLRNDD